MTIDVYVSVSPKGADISSSKGPDGTLSREKSSQKSTSRYKSSSVPKSSATKNANELISTLHSTFIPSPDTGTRLADNGSLTTTTVHTTKTEDPSSASEDTVQETKGSIVSTQTLGPVNGRTLSQSSVVTAGVLPKTTTGYSTILPSISTGGQTTHSDLKTRHTKDLLSTSVETVSHSSAPFESGTPILLSSVDLKSDVGKTRDVSSAAASALVANLSPSPTFNIPTTRQSSTIAIHPAMKPSSSVLTEILTGIPGSNNKDVSSLVNLTTSINHIVSKQQRTGILSRHC